MTAARWIISILWTIDYWLGIYIVWGVLGRG